MEIVVSQAQGQRPITVFHVKGDLNVTTFEQLLDRAQEAVVQGASDLVMDLSAVPYMSSAGIRAINNVFRMLPGSLPPESEQEMQKGIMAGTFKSPHLKLVNPTPHVMEVLKMAGVDMFLEIHPSVQAAVASY